MYCCAAFDRLVANAGERGIAALVRRSQGRIYFVLQSRGVSYDDQKKLQPSPIKVTVNIASDTGLQCCPFCGRRLDELVKASPEAYEQLANKHREILSVDF